MDTAQSRLSVEDAAQPKAKIEAGPSMEKEAAPKWAVVARIAAQELCGCFSRIANALDTVYGMRNPRPAMPPTQAAAVKKNGKRPILDAQTGEPRKKRREMTKFNLFVQKEMELIRPNRKGESQQKIMKEVCQKWRVAPENPNRKLPDGSGHHSDVDSANARKAHELADRVHLGTVPGVHNSLAVVATEVKALDAPPTAGGGRTQPAGSSAEGTSSEDEASSGSDDDAGRAKGNVKSEKK
eukprot:jgi/Mesvir1/28164/Mv04726-RA.1